MYLLKNAWKNVTRSKGRNILIGLIVFVISVSTCISLSIRQAAEEAKTSGLDDVEITRQITVDRQSMIQSMSDPANQILMSYETLKAAVDDMDSVFSQTNGTYVFADQEKYEQFQDDVKEMGLDDSYTVTSQDVNSYAQSLIPLENLSNFALYFFIIVLIIGAIVLMVINIFNIRERKYEIGVLTAIGMKKRNVCVQLFMRL